MRLDHEPISNLLGRADIARHLPLDAIRIALRTQHVDDALRALVAEELTELLFVISNAVLLHQRDKVARGVTGECRAAKVRVFRKEVLGSAVDVSEVAAPAARDADLLAELWRVLDQHSTAPALSRDRGAHHSGRAGADDNDVEVQFRKKE